MPQFKYKAIDAGGKVRRGSTEARDIEALIQDLRAQGLFYMEAQKENVAPPSSPGQAATSGGSMTRLQNGFFKAVPLEALAIFTTQLSIMIRTALPLFQALSSLASMPFSKKFKEIINDINRMVQQGTSLSKAFGKYPDVFDSVYVSLVSAGEATGRLDEMLDRLVGYLNFQREMKSKIRSALLYPSLIVLTSVGVVSFMVIFIMPTFVDIFAKFDMQLPLPTLILLQVSENIRTYGLFYGAGLVAAWIYFMRWMSHPVHSRPMDHIRMQLPVVGGLVRNIVMTRVLRTLSALVAGGVPILQALELAQSSAGNVVFKDIIGQIHKSASEGRGLTSALYGNPYFPDQVSHMIKNAEQTGTLPEALTKIADFYEKETDVAIKNMFAVLEPIFVIVLGLLVAGVAVAIFLPIFQLDAGFQ